MSYHNRPKDWHLGNKLIIHSLDHFDSLINDGFEVKVIKFYGPPNQLNCALLFLRGEEQITADATSISDYVLHLRELYDFKRGESCFVYIPDTAIYHEFDEEFFALIPGNKPDLFVSKNIGLSRYLFEELNRWFENEKSKKDSHTKLSRLFLSVFIVSEKNSKVFTKCFNKMELSLEAIRKIRSDYERYDKSIAMSFFLVGSKSDTSFSIGDTLIGMTLYDLKNNRTLAFNILSLSSYIELRPIDENNGLHDVLKYLFNLTINQKLEAISYVPLPISSPCYAALPWISYSVLLPIEIDNSDKPVPEQKISIPEFFIFGLASSREKESSFLFKNFSVDKQGLAICVLNFRSDGKQIKYTLRFDQSAGEPLVHLDYSYYVKNEIKLIAHKVLDLENVLIFSLRLFIAMMLAGIFDAYFSTLVKGGIKGLTELGKKNPAFLYPYYWIWMLESFSAKLSARQDGFGLLRKLYEGVKLKVDEEKFIKSIKFGDFNVASEDENGNINGLSNLGYVVLVRYDRGHSHLKAT